MISQGNGDGGQSIQPEDEMADEELLRFVEDLDCNYGFVLDRTINRIETYLMGF